MFTDSLVSGINISPYIADEETPQLHVTHNRQVHVGIENSPLLISKLERNSPFLNSLPALKIQQQTNPKVHTFKILNANEVNNYYRQKRRTLNIQTPVLMCFICELSFGVTKLFALHANKEHGIDLKVFEKSLLLKRQYASAIIQRNMDENPQISFLEPDSIESKNLFTQTTTTTTKIETRLSNNKMQTKNNEDNEIFSETNYLHNNSMDNISLHYPLASSSTTTLAPTTTSNKSGTKKYFTQNKSAHLEKKKIKENVPETSQILPIPRNGNNPADFIDADEKQTTTSGTVATNTAADLSKHRDSPSEPKNYTNNKEIGNEYTSLMFENEKNTCEQRTQITSPPVPNPSVQLSSLHASWFVLSAEQNCGNVNIISDFLQQQLTALQQQNNLTASLNKEHIPGMINTCPEHGDQRGVDCKACEAAVFHMDIKEPKLSTSLKATLASSNQLSQSTRNVIALNNMRQCANTVITGGSTVKNSFTIGACSDHINGRPLDVECIRCELILNSARLNTNSHQSTRNSCKTLKCPQCNWHYKYQETLEIHMREKHPDGESACGYCLAGQQHPRLARGESYSCGYKPYRCEICNYSTTTKGNLSIHMQSDKHLNNVQELNSSHTIVAATNTANGVVKLDNAATNYIQQYNMSRQQRPKVNFSNCDNENSLRRASDIQVSQSEERLGELGYTTTPVFRCDMCNYETAVARNLRIHMTSDKHMQNLTILQNNIKRIQALSLIQHHNQKQLQEHSTEQVAGPHLPNLASNQTVMMQLLHRTPISQIKINSDKVDSVVSCPDLEVDKVRSGPYSVSEITSAVSNNLTSLSTELPFKTNLFPTELYSCLICENFNTSNIDVLHQHLLFDRSYQTTKKKDFKLSTKSTCRDRSPSPSSSPTDIMTVQNNNYICFLCKYKTNLRANFQLHSKTDKHLQKINFFNHLREGGSRNRQKLKYYQQQHQQMGINSVQIKCNCCDFFSNSIQQLKLHIKHTQHETMKLIFQHLNDLLQKEIDTENVGFEKSVVDETVVTDYVPSSAAEKAYMSKALYCKLCNVRSNSLLEMIHHVKAIHYLEIDNLIKMDASTELQAKNRLNEIFDLCDIEPTHQSGIGYRDGSISPVYNFSAIHPETIPEGHRSENLDIALYVSEELSSLSTDQTGNHGNVTCLENDYINFPGLSFKCVHCSFSAFSRFEIKRHTQSAHQKGIGDISFIPTNRNIALKNVYNVSGASSPNSAEKRPEHLGADFIDGKSQNSITATNRNIALKNSHKSGTSSPNSTEQRTQHLAGDFIDGNSQSSITTDSEKRNVEKVMTHFKHNKDTPLPNIFQCPLCQDNFVEVKDFDIHLMTLHSVDRDGLIRLISQLHTLVSKETSDTVNTENVNVNVNVNVNSSLSTDRGIPEHNNSSSEMSESTFDFLRCQQCDSTFRREQELLLHAQQLEHYSMKHGEYVCLAFNNTANSCPLRFPTSTAMVTHYSNKHTNLVISERHVYKFRCKQCSLAFKTREKLSTHLVYHTIRDTTKCRICIRNFRTVHALKSHMEIAHNESRDFDKCEQLSDEQNIHPTESEIEDVTPKNEVTIIESETTPTTRCVPSPNALSAELQSASSQPIDKQNRITILNESIKNQSSAANELFQNLGHKLCANPHETNDLHNLQQIAAAAAASGLALNPVEMLNIIQFHHLMSLNIMNLTPPLIIRTDNTVPMKNACSANFDAEDHTENTTLDTRKTPVFKDMSADVVPENTKFKKVPHAVSSSQIYANQKRARTRITNDQLRILRSHFDINNSPSEESISEMSRESNLPIKVVKHWFRNTLFKERQRNKDSPYNFNNPPLTTFNFEEYERNVQTKLDPLIDQVQNEAVSRSPSSHSTCNIGDYLNVDQSQKDIGSLQTHEEVERDECSSFKLNAESKSDHLNTLTSNDFRIKAQGHMETIYNQTITNRSTPNERPEEDLSSPLKKSGSPTHNDISSIYSASEHFSCDNRSESNSSETLSRSETPNNIQSGIPSLNIMENHSHQLEGISLSQMGPPKKHQIATISAICGGTTERTVSNNASGTGISTNNRLFEKHSRSPQYDNNSNSSTASNTGGKRANRTRFTDYQIKVLQEFFENNSYPKDSDLEYLSKLLLLSPRVIVVWFQNARQKQRKIYENQPNSTLCESEEKKQNINYACKKCSLVFQRYYELIRHQKNHCFKEENNKRSAKAQIAAAQIAQHLSSEDSNSSVDINSVSTPTVPAHHSPLVSTSSATPGYNKNILASSELTSVANVTSPSTRTDDDVFNEPKILKCNKCNMSFVDIQQLRQHQLIHIFKQNLRESEEITNLESIPFYNVLQKLNFNSYTQIVNQGESFNKTHINKRKYSDMLSKDDDYLPLETFTPDLRDKSQSPKASNLFYRYFLCGEGKYKNINQSAVNEDFLPNYYQSTELKKLKNYDFLIQYYERNEQSRDDAVELDSKKPNIESLWQYYQLMESYKYFQLDYPPPQSNDGTMHVPKAAFAKNSITTTCLSDSNINNYVDSTNIECDDFKLGKPLNFQSSDNIQKDDKAVSFLNDSQTDSKAISFLKTKDNDEVDYEKKGEATLNTKSFEKIDQLDGIHELNNQYHCNRMWQDNRCSLSFLSEATGATSSIHTPTNNKDISKETPFTRRLGNKIHSGRSNIHCDNHSDKSKQMLKLMNNLDKVNVANHFIQVS